MLDDHGVFKLSAYAISLSVDRHESLKLEGTAPPNFRQSGSLELRTSNIRACTMGPNAAKACRSLAGGLPLGPSNKFFRWLEKFI
jgi:hypothetical protein